MAILKKFKSKYDSSEAIFADNSIAFRINPSSTNYIKLSNSMLLLQEILNADAALTEESEAQHLEQARKLVILSVGL